MRMRFMYKMQSIKQKATLIAKKEKKNTCKKNPIA